MKTRGRGNIAVRCHPLLSEAAGSSAAAAVRQPEGAAYLSLAQIFSGRGGNLYFAVMASSSVMADCFYRRRMPKIRRSPVMNYWFV